MKWNIRPKTFSLLMSLAFVIVILVVILFYREIQDDHWRSEKKAVRIALEQTEIVKVDETRPFVGDTSYIVVTGWDEDDNRWISWVGEQEIHAERADAGVSRSELRAVLTDRDPEAQILRIMPGKWRDHWAWEIFYKKETEQGTRHYYDYYTFAEGTHLDSYILAVER